MAEKDATETGPPDVDLHGLGNMRISLYMPLREVSQAREFRLLKLHSDQGNGLSCELVSYMIHHSPSYRALSYTWKGPFGQSDPGANPMEEILVDGQIMNVSANLALALRALRDWHGGSDEFVWADAICIDQNSFRERAYQVSIMGEIYCNADEVFIWLGAEGQDSDRAMNLMKVLAKCRRDFEFGRGKTMAMALDPKWKPHWKALEAWMNRRWWGRVWVLQETVLARKAKFCCGRSVLDDEDLFDGARALRDVWDQLWNALDQQYGIQLRVPTYHAMDGMSRLRAARFEGRLFNMLTCHHRTMSPRATDLRDYIFAKMGMASNGYIVKPSYTDSVTDVFTNFVLDYIREAKSLEIIHFDARPRETRNLPSWVPDWTAGHGASPLQPDPEANPKNTFLYYAADRGEPADITVETASDGRKILMCKGYIIDTIDGVARAEESSWAGSEATHAPSQPHSSKLVYENDTDIFQALWHSLTMMQDHHGNALDPMAGSILAESCQRAERRLAEGLDISRLRFEKAYSCIRDFLIGGRSVADRMGEAAARTPPYRVIGHNERADTEGAMAHALTFRRLLSTIGGYIGTGPSDTAVGDVVAIMFGSRVPVILRSFGDGLYNVVGAGDIRGIMHGEAFDAFGKEKIEPETIKLI